MLPPISTSRLPSRLRRVLSAAMLIILLARKSIHCGLGRHEDIGIGALVDLLRQNVGARRRRGSPWSRSWPDRRPPPPSWLSVSEAAANTVMPVGACAWARQRQGQQQGYGNPRQRRVNPPATEWTSYSSRPSVGWALAKIGNNVSESSLSAKRYSWPSPRCRRGSCCHAQRHRRHKRRIRATG